MLYRLIIGIRRFLYTHKLIGKSFDSVRSSGTRSDGTSGDSSVDLPGGLFVNSSSGSSDNMSGNQSASAPASLPVVVVGNLTVGGTGKTPLCLYLVKIFQTAGWRPAIVSRGYGGKRHETAYLIGDTDTPAEVGDEPLMLAQQSGVPVCVCVKRALAVRYLAEHTDTTVIFADDGLQHLAMPRVASIVAVDGQRGFGNGWLLPAGPLREPLSRLRHADIVAVQFDIQAEDELHHSLQKQTLTRHASETDGKRFSLQLSEAVSLTDGKRVPLTHFADQPVFAMAGIGHPQRFFKALHKLGLQLTSLALPDHHDFDLQSFAQVPDLPVLVTSKDAVKLRALGKLPREVFEVPATLVVSAALQNDIARLEKRLRNLYSQSNPQHINP